jgi:hypothetical protein
MDYTISTTDEHELILSLADKEFRMRRTATLSLKTIRHMLRNRFYFDFEVDLRTIDGVKFKLGVSYHTQLPEEVTVEHACLYVADNYFDITSNYNACCDLINCWYAESQKLDKVAGWKSLDVLVGGKMPYCLTSFNISLHRDGVVIMHRTNMREYFVSDWLPMVAFVLVAEAITLYYEGNTQTFTLFGDNYHLNVIKHYRNGLNLVIARKDRVYMRGVYQDDVWELFVGDEVMAKAVEQIADVKARGPKFY